jgi:myo-inositol-1(or 4)-monophosphatase
LRPATWQCVLVHDVMALAARAARAGAEAVRAAGRGTVVATKGSVRELVTDADLASEAAILEVIRAARPGDAVLTEESGEQAGTSGVRWIVDPLDGTVNFVRGLDRFAVSVAAERGDRVIAAAVCRPIDDLTLSLSRVGVVASAGTPGVADPVSPSTAVVSFAVPYDAAGRRRAYEVLAAVAPRVVDLRNSGSSVCDLAAVALGELDGFIGFGQKPWDISAGLRLVEAAGGTGAVVRIANSLDMLVAGGRRLVGSVVDWTARGCG